MSENVQIQVTGSCHCKKIRFKALVSQQVKTLLCNCSMCSLTGHEHLFVEHADFTLISGGDNLTTYRFGTQKAEHLFCSSCGIKSFYQPRSHPDAYSINVASLDNAGELDIRQELFDGQNWEKAKAELSE